MIKLIEFDIDSSGSKFKFPELLEYNWAEVSSTCWYKLSGRPVSKHCDELNSGDEPAQGSEA